MEAFDVDPSDKIYQASRYCTWLGLEVYSVVAASYGVAKGVMAISKLAKMPAQIPKVLQLVESLKWPSPAKGRTIINGIEYTIHSLERMSPRGIIHSGTDIIGRGVPPSVVENAIKFGVKTTGKTSQEIVHTYENVQVVTNLDATSTLT